MKRKREPSREGSGFGHEIEKKEIRKIEGREKKEKQSVWFGLGMFGLVGWSVAVPTILFTMIGIWIDSRTEGGISWTLTLMMGGIVLGCLNAWRWIKRESED